MKKSSITISLALSLLFLTLGCAMQDGYVQYYGQAEGPSSAPPPPKPQQRQAASYTVFNGPGDSYTTVRWGMNSYYEKESRGRYGYYNYSFYFCDNYYKMNTVRTYPTYRHYHWGR